MREIDECKQEKEKQTIREVDAQGDYNIISVIHNRRYVEAEQQ